MSVSFDELEFESYPKENGGVTWVTEIYDCLSAAELITLMEEIFVKLELDPQKVIISANTDYDDNSFFALEWDEDAKNS